MGADRQVLPGHGRQEGEAGEGVLREGRQPSQGPHLSFVSDLAALPPRDRDAFVDRAFGLTEILEDRALPPGCVGYLPCGVDVVRSAIALAEITAADVVVDVGSGVGRAAALFSLLSGARVVGIEVQPHLVRAARDLIARLDLAQRVSFIEGDAAEEEAEGSVFFFYCPFSGPRLARVIDRLRGSSTTRAVITVDVPAPERDWLTTVSVEGGVQVLRLNRPC